MECIGYGAYEGKCDNPAGSTHSYYWCQRCDDLRMAHLSQKFAEIEQRMKQRAAQAAEQQQ